jgi:hypothetical protein
VHAVVFTQELHGWHTIEADWPKDRSFAAFQKWFRVERASSENQPYFAGGTGNMMTSGNSAARTLTVLVALRPLASSPVIV